jgi:bifunctional DNase/RNase
MIEVTVESIRVSLINQQRLVVLRENGSARYLPIWIGPYEAEAITMGLQGAEVRRPMTHDLLRGVIEQLGAEVEYIFVNDLHDDTFYARIVLDVEGEHMEVDARPSDAISLAVRVECPIYVAEDVMDRAGQVPAAEFEGGEEVEGSADRLEVFREFVEGLDLGEMDDEEDAS